MLNEIFPTGWVHFLIGGVLIGLGVSLMFVFTGRVVGLSSFYSASLSWVSKRAYFQNENHVSSRFWRTAVAVGLVLGALIWFVAFAEVTVQATNVSVYRLGLGGILVGFGARLSNGCTSGHGICGLSSLSLSSLLAVLVFMMCAIVTASSLEYLTRSVA